LGQRPNGAAVPTSLHRTQAPARAVDVVCAGAYDAAHMRGRVPRILLNVVTTASLLLCVVAVGLWLRSYRVIDRALWLPAGGSDRGYGYHSGMGVVTARRLVTSRPIGADQAQRETRPVTDVERRSHRQWIEAETWHGFAWQETPFTGRSVDGAWHEISAPYWFIALCGATMPVVRVAKRSVRARRSGHGACPACGYDLRATPDRCPECGAAPAAPPA
jgi:hypothetical protein